MKKQIDPAMHSAEHLLNQTMVRMFDCDRCFSAHIEKKKSKCDYHFDHPLSAEEVKEIEKKVNGVIMADMPVQESFVAKEVAERQFNLNRLPDRAEDAIRVISIGDYDACPCIGPHVLSTKQIGRFRIISTRFESGVLRIRYKLDRDVQQ